VGSPKPRHITRLAREDEVLERIRGTVGSGIEAFGLRDDAGLVDLPAGGSLVVSVDSVVQGVHVDLTVCSPADVGWKSVMGALSDLAAMGVAPLGALIALCVPGASGSGELALEVMSGVAEASSASGCPVVGGDVSGAGELMVAVTVMGAVSRRGDGPLGPVSRAGAQPGDVVLVTGPCGGSAAGLRELRAGREGADARWSYRRPVARLREGETARRAGAHAMIDVSDGLALDLHRLADASGVGFGLDEVPVAEGATLDEALGGGEDYELLIAVSVDGVEALGAGFAAAGLREPVPVGVIADDPALRTWRGRDLEPMGWQHRLG
jgi:thiamine-monophosphate kinase